MNLSLSIGGTPTHMDEIFHQKKKKILSSKKHARGRKGQYQHFIRSVFHRLSPPDRVPDWAAPSQPPSPRDVLIVLQYRMQGVLCYTMAEWYQISTPPPFPLVAFSFPRPRGSSSDKSRDSVSVAFPGLHRPPPLSSSAWFMRLCCTLGE